MTQRQTTILGFLTLALVLAAIWVLFGETDGPADTEEPSALLPGLAKKASDLATIKITGGDQTTRLERTDAGWTVAERASYVADTDKVQRLLSGLVQARRLSQKTARADRLPRLGLGESAIKVELLGTDGQSMVGLAVGDAVTGLPGQRYARPLAEEAAWTVEGLPSVAADPSDWIDARLFDLDRNRIARIAVTPPEGGAYTLERTQAGADIKLADQTEDEVLKDFGGADRILASLAFLNAEDVRPESDTPEIAPWRYRVESFDGLALDITLWPDEAGPWIALSADTGAPAIEEGVDPAADAADIAQRLSGWLYQLPRFKGDDLTQARADLLEDTEEDIQE